MIGISLLLTSIKSFSNDIYDITVYHFKDTQQESIIDNYLQNAFIPAAHRAGKVNIGVFKPISNDTSADKKIYMIVTYRSFEEIVALQKLLSIDMVYNQAGKDYITASYKTPPYARMENIIMVAFDKAPYMMRPVLTSDKKDHIYELRSYESATEAYHTNKLKMFNQGDEVGIFKSINANAVFYADVISGDKMPNLMYLTCYENMADRDAHWKAFGDNDKWKQLNAMDEYKNNVSKADIILMHAATYSDY